MNRKHYLDNIRWVTVLLVLIYHVFYMFNAVGVLGGVGAFTEVQYQDAFMYVVYPWFMVILFMVAGMSSRYYLESRSHKEFIKDRTRKLLIPSTIGVAILWWVIGYMNIYIGGGLDMIPKFILYPICVLSGSGPLWFIQLLWLFSLLLVVIRKLDKNDKLYNLCGKANGIVILLLAFLVWGSSQILNMPLITVFRFGIYFVTYLIGYFVFSHDEVMEKIEKMRIPMLVLAIVSAVAYTWYYFGDNFADAACLQSFFTNMYLWIVILAIFGCFKAWANKTNRFATYMAKSSFGIYVVHYVIVFFGAYALKTYTALPVAVIYLALMVATLTLSPVLYEVLRRIPILRYFLFGIKKKKK